MNLLNSFGLFADSRSYLNSGDPDVRLGSRPPSPDNCSHGPVRWGNHSAGRGNESPNEYQNSGSRPRENVARPLNVRVLDAARHLWPWAYRHFEIDLNDGARAAELLEEVALEVSARLRTEPEVERNLNGYLITAFHNRVGSQFLTDSRLAYEGLLYDLEENHQPRAPDWVTHPEACSQRRRSTQCRTTATLKLGVEAQQPTRVRRG